jgi:hypothetical protein
MNDDDQFLDGRSSRPDLLSYCSLSLLLLGRGNMSHVIIVAATESASTVHQQH